MHHSSQIKIAGYNGRQIPPGQVRMFRSIARRLLKLLFWLAVGSALLVLVLRWIPPPGTALMLERTIDAWRDDQPIDLQRTWRPWAELPDDLKMAVIAAEDQKFAEHWGFDAAAIRAALAHNQQGGSVRGASTLSQQVAKNLFLWSGRSWLRNGLEVWFTGLIELLWPKQRILEVYLNSAEWGDGIFGAEAAARHHFKVGAPYLSRQQSSLLAAVLPNPRARSASRPNAHTARRANWIRQQMWQLGGSHYLNRLQPSRPEWWPDWLKGV
jgi:monofunctional biosynthetic peptidoglycan transglycosylase